MSSTMLDLTDANIHGAYKAVLQGGPTNWLLLSYGDTAEVAVLYASGQGGVDDLREQIQDDYVFFGLCRERFNGESHFCLIVYIPPSLSSTNKGKVLAHARSIGLLFSVNKSTLTASRKEDISVSAVRQASIELEARKMQRSVSAQNPAPLKLFAQRGTPVRRTASDGVERALAPRGSSPSPARSQRSAHSAKSSLASLELPPPPPPPKKPLPPPPGKLVPPTFLATIDDLSPITPGAIDRIVVEPEEYSKPSGSRFSAFAFKPIVPRPRPDPEELARQRADARKRQEEEEEAAIHAEKIRQAQLRLEKLELEKHFQEEERERREQMAREVRRAAEERRRREEQEAREEEARVQALQEKKAAERARRLAESRRIEGWRAEQAREQAARARSREAARVRDERARRTRLASADLTRTEGWVTVQAGAALVWRRRWFRVLGAADMLLFKNRQEAERVGAAPLDAIAITRARRVMEWTQNDRDGDNEQLQELEAIPNSFAVELSEGEGTRVCMMYTDTSEEKDIIMGIISRAAGLLDA